MPGDLGQRTAIGKSPGWAFGSPAPVAVHVSRHCLLAVRLTDDVQPATAAGFAPRHAVPSRMMIFVVAVPAGPQPCGIVSVSVPLLPATARFP